MAKNIMIPESLFVALFKCFVLDLPDKCSYCIGCESVKKMLTEKGNQMNRHNLYTQSKTAATEDEREKNRIAYLDTVGMRDSYRWKKDHNFFTDHTDSRVTRGCENSQEE